jgi:ABC-2 type transport system ATP-binding protein
MILFDKVTKGFRRVRVLDGLTLRIDAGERVALVGSNGAGKTTLIRCLLGEYGHSGVVSVDGMDPRRDRRRVLMRIGFVPQHPPPLKTSVAQLIGFAAELSRCGRGPMEEIAARLGLDIAGLRHRPFVKLSGGQKQKLLIAIALGRGTDILVMDEPAANLDPEARRRFFDLLAQRQDQSVMLISSHRLDEVAPLVNRLIELDQGAVVLDDRVADSVARSSVLACRLRFTRPDAAVAKALARWGLGCDAEGREWSGKIAGPDRLRFLGVLSRYAALLAEVSLVETDPAQSPPVAAAVLCGERRH